MTNVPNEVLANLRPRKTYQHEQVSEICPCMTYYSEVLEGIESGAAWTLDYKWYLPYILTTVAFFKPRSRVCVIGVYLGRSSDPSLWKVYRHPLRGMQSSADAPRIQKPNPGFSKED